MSAWDLLYLGLGEEIGLLRGIWISIQYYFSWTYLSDIEYGFIDDLKELIFMSAYLIVAGLLIWSARTSKITYKTKD